jgi:glycogen phosphorylase
LFGLTAGEVAGSRDWYKPMWHYRNELEVRQALDLLFSRNFSPGEPDIFEPIRERLVAQGDYYMHLADLSSYARAHERMSALYSDPHAWARKALLNVAASGHFSADRTIREYARDVWHIEPSSGPC